jgi:hypothetical protein
MLIGYSLEENKRQKGKKLIQAFWRLRTLVDAKALAPNVWSSELSSN